MFTIELGMIQGVSLAVEWVWQHNIVIIDFFIVRMVIFYGED